MAASLVTDFQQSGDSMDSTTGEDQLLRAAADQELMGLEDFNIDDLQLDGVDFSPLDNIWSSNEQAVNDDAMSFNRKLEENFNLDEDFNQMLNDWDNQLNSLQQTSGMEEILPTLTKSEDIAVETDIKSPVQQQQQHQTVTLKKPNTVSYRGLAPSAQSRQFPISSARSPLVTRGVCYTRTGGLGVSRSVQSGSGSLLSSTSRVSTSQYSAPSSRTSSEDGPPLLFSPVSPMRSPAVHSSNAPDFFIASTRSTADVVKTSSFSRIMNQSRNSIICSNPDTTPARVSTERSSQVKIIAAVSPKSDGTSSAKILSSSSIRESLPKELIDKIRAASQGRKTIAIIEPINRKESPAVQTEQLHYRTRQPTRINPVATNTIGKWRNVGIVPPYSNNVSDHDYCSPNRAGSRFSRKYLNAQHKVLRQIEESLSRNKGGGGRIISPTEEGETSKKDSGLESCEMSDASEDGALYDKLPRYLTNVSVQTVESRSIQDDHGYNRLPSYLIKPQQSLLKTNLSKALAEKNNIVISSVDTNDQKWPAAIISDVKAEVSIVDPNTTGVKLENINEEIKTVEYKVKDMVKSTQADVSVSCQTSSDKPPLKRRRDSLDSSSDETDASFRKYYKRRRSMHPRDHKARPGSRDRRRRYRGRSRSVSSSPDRRHAFGYLCIAV